MRKRQTKQIKVIQEDSASNFETAYNDFMRTLAEQDAKVIDTRFPEDQGFCVYVVYERMIMTPENFEDECKLNGITYHCENCPHYYQGEDLGCGHRDCQKVHSRYGVVGDCDACHVFYKELEGRLIKPVNVKGDEQDEK